MPLKIALLLNTLSLLSAFFYTTPANAQSLQSYACSGIGASIPVMSIPGNPDWIGHISAEFRYKQRASGLLHFSYGGLSGSIATGEALKFNNSTRFKNSFHTVSLQFGWVMMQSEHSRFFSPNVVVSCGYGIMSNQIDSYRLSGIKKDFRYHNDFIPLSLTLEQDVMHHALVYLSFTTHFTRSCYLDGIAFDNRFDHFMVISCGVKIPLMKRNKGVDQNCPCLYF